jgi:PPOX class probable F420-dependent enzyme
MAGDELEHYLAETKTLVLATTGRDNRPHLTALWYVIRDTEPWIFTYAGSQKVKNLERIPQATLMVESGTKYAQLRGAVLYADATIHRDPELVQEVGEQLFLRYDSSGQDGRSGLDEATREAIRTRALKRVAIQFAPTRVVSWDHSKLGRGY